MKTTAIPLAAGWLVAGLLAASVSAAAFDSPPRTMYKPQDIENARRNAERHGWAREIVREWEANAEFALQQDRGFFENLIPAQTPGTRYGQLCPACVLGGEGPGDTLGWNVLAPEQVRCGQCGTTYPNDEYPETLAVECPRMGQTFTYYQTPAERALGEGASGEERMKHALNRSVPHRATSFTGLARFRRAQWSWRQSLLLAKRYALTGEAAYAERTAWILNRFAQVFPNYLYHSYWGDIADLPPDDVAAEMGSRGLAQPRYGGRFPPEAVRHAYDWSRRRDEAGEYSTVTAGFWGAGRLATHGRGGDAGPFLEMIVAYDLTRSARRPDGSPVYGESMRRRILEDLIAAGADCVGQWDSKSNKGVATYAVSAAAGLLLDEPERLHRAQWGLDLMLEDAYHFDGFYSQSPGYAVHNFGNLQGLPDLLLGYSDPPGFHAEGGARLENLDPFADGRFHRAMLAMVRMLAPGNRLPNIGSTAADSVIRPRYVEIMAARMGRPYPALLEALTGRPFQEWGGEYSLWYRDPDMEAEGRARLPLRTEWFPGWHVGVLRGGREAENDTALYLVGNEHNWTVGTTHRHRDVLGLIYYAFGEELLADRCASVRRGDHLPEGWSRRWGVNVLTHTHNLVLVDEQVQRRQNRGWQARDCGSNLELFGAAPGVEVVQASGVNVYSQCDEYRRTCVQVRAPQGGHYVVDFFRVSGGRVHQYAMHCNGALEASPPALRPTQLSDAWRVWLDNAREVETGGQPTFTWRHRGVGLDLTLLNSLDRLVVADAPGERRGDPRGSSPPPIQQVLAERRAADGEDSLASRYAAVIAPYAGGASPVLSARLLADGSDGGAMAVEVRLPGRTDYIVSALDQERRAYGPVAAAGQFAFASVDEAGRLVQAYLLAGTRLEAGGERLELPRPATRHPVASVSGRVFRLAEPLTEELAGTAWYVLADGPHPLREGLPRPRTGFEVETASADSISVRDNPVLECDEITVLHAKWLGPAE